MAIRSAWMWWIAERRCKVQTARIPLLVKKGCPKGGVVMRRESHTLSMWKKNELTRL